MEGVGQRAQVPAVGQEEPAAHGATAGGVVAENGREAVDLAVGDAEEGPVGEAQPWERDGDGLVAP